MNRAAADINSPSVEEKSSVSRVKKSHGLYSFRVEGYSGLSTRVGDSTESPEFELCGHVWQLRIFPGGSLEAHRAYLSFYLASKSTRSARASYKLSVCSQVAGGTDESFASSGVRLFEAKGVQIDGWGRDKFMASTMLNDPEFGFQIDDIVIFKVEITVYGELESASFPPVSTVNSNKQLPSLSRCMRQLLATEDFADIILVFEQEPTESTTDHNHTHNTNKSHPTTLPTTATATATTTPRYEPTTVTLPPTVTPTLPPSSLSLIAQAEPSQTSQSNHTAPSQTSQSNLTAPSQTSQSNLTAPSLRLAGPWQTSPCACATTPYSHNTSSPCIHAHRAVLAARSPVFSAMLGRNEDGRQWLEASTGTIVIRDVEPEVMREVVHFMYCDDLTDLMVMDSMAEALLCAASKYQIAALSAACEAFLLHHLTVENAISLLRLADVLSLVKMKDTILAYVSQHGPAIAQTKEYALLEGELQREVRVLLDAAARRHGCGSRNEGERRFSTCSVM